eukprot:CAMPEP_0198111852 /NCGR_PEP_ID=MMETSP1442-20131203/3784_1 /TAXON_ID= /ORGANISM="Craspedostauros australis, Strain CCMP3328" /LENGTH=213 /DNA_ID=CAMNT_0043768451 /DNA_START=464 /DNA_END=1105 /DNA_ORIENTATION=-
MKLRPTLRARWSPGRLRLATKRTLLLVALTDLSAQAIIIEPGLGLQHNGQNVVVFEHTAMGTGGLVLNSPTPVRLGDLPIPRFRQFEKYPLMLGCGVDMAGEDLPLESSLETDAPIALRDLSPWFWLHDVPGVSGSYKLYRAHGDLFMGGSIDELAEILLQDDERGEGHIKFFRRYKAWAPEQLQNEIESGIWKFCPQDARSALDPVHFMARF